MVAELVYLLISSLLFLTLWETNNQDINTIYAWTARKYGRFHRAYEHVDLLVGP